jgi:hypothetical protein
VLRRGSEQVSFRKRKITVTMVLVMHVLSTQTATLTGLIADVEGVPGVLPLLSVQPDKFAFSQDPARSRAPAAPRRKRFVARSLSFTTRSWVTRTHPCPKHTLTVAILPPGVTALSISLLTSTMHARSLW